VAQQKKLNTIDNQDCKAIRRNMPESLIAWMAKFDRSD
jgi:hypothetical protein